MTTHTSMRSHEHSLARAYAHTPTRTSRIHHPSPIRSYCGLASPPHSYPSSMCSVVAALAFARFPSQAMPFVANDELCCPICDVLYSTANSAFVLSCAKDGCQGHLCFECLQRAVFPGNRSSQDATTCPHCRRAVLGYSYAFFAAHKNVSALQDKLTASEAEVGRLTKSLATARTQAEEATRRLNDWCRWATAAKSALQAMPSSATPPHVRAVVSPQPDSEAARSRSPRSVRPSGALYSSEYVEYNG